MGLSSKQVSDDLNAWNHALQENEENLEFPKTYAIKNQQQQQQEQLKCPRCNSTNTKFCYYNNYNKSQPRHFCKECKRHWTKGGTLRNVPVGGGRKNKRLKVSKPDTKTTTTTTATSLPLERSFEEKTFSKAFYQNFLKQQHSSLLENSIVFTSNGLNDEIFDNSTTKTTSLGIQIPYSNLGSFESNPCSISSPILYNFTSENGNNHVLESDAHHHHHPWTMHTSSTQSNNNKFNNNLMMDMMSNSNWGFDGFDKLVCNEDDITMPWDDSHHTNT